jgi:hypothetical protein
MKNRKNMGCRIKGRMQLGAWAELYFMVLAMSQGLRVSSPYGGFAFYDVGVEGSTGPILRVQVKCTGHLCRDGGYAISVSVTDGPNGRRRGYAPGTVDFFAFYLIPTDDWYIVPYEVIGNRKAHLQFRPHYKRQKYGQYQEAWHLLLNASKSKHEGPIDIRACCDEAETAGARKLMQPPAVRRMFRGVFQE